MSDQSCEGGYMSSEKNARAGQEFMEEHADRAEDEKRRYLNMRETLLDVLMDLERECDLNFAKQLKRRALDARSINELRMIMDGLLVLAGFNVRDETG